MSASTRALGGELAASWGLGALERTNNKIRLKIPNFLLRRFSKVLIFKILALNSQDCSWKIKLHPSNPGPRFLCDPSCIAILQQALHDESFATRKVGVRTMGRLTRYNPASASSDFQAN